MANSDPHAGGQKDEIDRDQLLRGLWDSLHEVKDKLRMTTIIACVELRQICGG